MSDLESSLLTALLEFAHTRLDKLLNTLATDAEQLLITLVPGASPVDKANAAATNAANDLAAARTHLTAFANDIAAGPSTLCADPV